MPTVVISLLFLFFILLHLLSFSQIKGEPSVRDKVLFLRQGAIDERTAGTAHQTS